MFIPEHERLAEDIRKWTELQSTLAAFGAMMHKQKIKKEDGSEISYSEAFEVKDGNWWEKSEA